MTVCESRAQRRMCGSKKEVTGGRRKWHNEELCNFYSLQNIIITKPSRMRWGEKNCFYRKNKRKKTTGKICV
jgi:hypothetical protein